MIEPITLDELTTPRAATQRLRATGLAITYAEPTYLRHKPGETTIIAYRFTLPDADETWGYAHWSACLDRAAEIHAKATSLRPRPSPIGAGLTRLDAHTVLYGFPNDARLGRLRWYTDPRKLKRSLEPLTAPAKRISGRRTNVQILRYKPERRVVAKVDIVTNDHGDQPVLVRYSTQHQAHRLAEIATHLRRHGVATPAPVAQLDDNRVAVDQFVEGRQLRDVIQANDADGANLADALRRFHTTPEPRFVDRRTAASDLRKALQGLVGLAAWEPILAAATAAVAQLLTQNLPDNTEPEVLLHGDLHANNILVHRNVTTFVDLERVAVGSAAIDLGYFRAHAIAQAIRQPNWSPTALHFADTTIDYYSSDAERIDLHALAWHTAIGLVDQALLVTRHLEPRWPITSAQLLDAAHTQLQHRASISSGVNR